MIGFLFVFGFVIDRREKFFDKLFCSIAVFGREHAVNHLIRREHSYYRRYRKRVNVCSEFVIRIVESHFYVVSVRLCRHFFVPHGRVRARRVSVDKLKLVGELSIGHKLNHLAVRHFCRRELILDERTRYPIFRDDRRSRSQSEFVICLVTVHKDVGYAKSYFCTRRGLFDITRQRISRKFVGSGHRLADLDPAYRNNAYGVVGLYRIETVSVSYLTRAVKSYRNGEFRDTYRDFSVVLYVHPVYSSVCAVDKIIAFDVGKSYLFDSRRGIHSLIERKRIFSRRAAVCFFAAEYVYTARLVARDRLYADIFEIINAVVSL